MEALSWQEAEGMSDGEGHDDGQVWHIVQSPTQGDHSRMVDSHGYERFDLLKEQVQRQMRGQVRLLATDGQANLALPAHGGADLDELVRVVQLRFPLERSRFIFDLVMSARIEKKGQGRPRFMVAYQDSAGSDNVGRDYDALVDKEVRVWLLDQHKLLVWPPQAVRQAILELLPGVPRGWSSRAAGRTLQERDMFPVFVNRHD